MANRRTSAMKRVKIKLFPFLYKKCPDGNWHKRNDKFCYCRVNEHHVGGTDSWNGGIYKFATGLEIEK